jgi:hypothetical protein
LEQIPENLVEVADIWTSEIVQSSFAKNHSKIFYFVPQVTEYQPRGFLAQREKIEDYK